MIHWLEAAMLAEREAPTRLELKPLRRRRHTGRNFQLSLKVKREAAEHFGAMADGEGLTFGELFERVIAAYEASRKI